MEGISLRLLSSSGAADAWQARKTDSSAAPPSKRERKSRKEKFRQAMILAPEAVSPFCVSPAACMFAVEGHSGTLELPASSMFKRETWRLELVVGFSAVNVRSSFRWQWKPCHAPTILNGIESIGCCSLLRLCPGWLCMPPPAGRRFPREQGSCDAHISEAASRGLRSGVAECAMLVAQPDGNLTLASCGALCRTWILLGASAENFDAPSPHYGHCQNPPSGSNMHALCPGDRIRVGKVELAVTELAPSDRQSDGADRIGRMRASRDETPKSSASNKKVLLGT